MREIVLDTETTGFDPEQGDRIVEIGAVELWNHVATGRTYHQYINPERSMPDEAFQVHGLGDEFLRDKPKFAQIADDFLDFRRRRQDGDPQRRLRHEIPQCRTRLGEAPQIPWEQAIDTLAIAKKKFPGSPASLDALCRRFAIDNSSRTLHGALLDTEILAEVYLELIGGKQPDFGLAQARRVRLDAAGNTELAATTAAGTPAVADHGNGKGGSCRLCRASSGKTRSGGAGPDSGLSGLLRAPAACLRLLTALRSRAR